MKNYGQYCPVARASELLAERWTPLIVRNLLLGCETFGEIADGLPGISRSLLTQRLRQLERYGVLSRLDEDGSVRYELTEAGRDLEHVADALGNWGARWLEMTADHMDPYAVIWAVSKFIDPTHIPGDRMVVRFDITDTGENFWIVAEVPEPEVCMTDPLYDIDLVVSADREALASWHTGRISLADAVRLKVIELSGIPKYRRTFYEWGGLSKFADVQPVSVD